MLEGWTQDPFSSIDHHTVVSLEGVELGELTANGSGPYGGVFEIPPGVLVDGTNLVTVEAVELDISDVVFLDGIVLRYRRGHQAASDRLRFSLDATGTHRVDGDLILETEGAEAEGGNEFHEKLLIDRETLAEHRGATGIERFGTIDHAKVAEPCLAASGVEVAQYPRQTPAE